MTFEGLSEWRRAELARHLRQTYGMTYGGLERQEAMMFRLAYDDPAVIRTEAPAVLLRELADAAAAGGTVRLPRMKAPDATRVSELLRQTADRVDRDARDEELGRFARQTGRDWDRVRRVPADEYQRAELVRMRSI